jgi:hypothetical protein
MKPRPPAPALTPAVAWRQCARAGLRRQADLRVVCLALVHAGRIGAARDAMALRDDCDAEHLLAARLFVDLQLRLRRDPRQVLDSLQPGDLERLLAALPAGWQAVVSGLLDGGDGEPDPPRRMGRPARPAMGEGTGFATAA